MKHVLTRLVDADGVLRLELELGETEAGKAVCVTVEAVKPPEIKDRSPLTDEEWRQAVKDLAGSWLGDFERPPQGEYEQREEFP